MLRLVTTPDSSHPYVANLGRGTFNHVDAPAATQGPEHEDALVASAIRTDFILSAEIMVISLNEVADEPLLSRALILVFVAIVITVGVYGVVALIVKMDDVGLHLAETRDGAAAATGRGLLKAMPIVLSVLAKVGIAAITCRTRLT